jgi:hypothetical protein
VWGSRNNDGRKMSSWNIALEEYNRFNNGTGGAFAIPSRHSADYDLVAELAQEVRRKGRPVRWEEMGYPDLETDIDRPVKPCPGGGNRTPSQASVRSGSVRAPSQGSVRSLGSTVRYSDGSRSTPSSVRTGSTVPQSQGPSRLPTPGEEPVRRTLDFIDTSIPTFAPGQWNPYTGRVEGLPPRRDIPQRAEYIPYGMVNIPRANTSGGWSAASQRWELPDED